MVSTGLALGKFAPLHKGHQLVLDEATNLTDEQVFVVYDSPEITDIPLPVRAGWLRRLYPRAEVIEAWGGSSEVGYTAEIMQRQEDFLFEVLRGREITHFFSSEPYGEHISKRLGCIDVRVDQARTKFSISATEIRRAPFEHRHYLDFQVYLDHVQRIVFVGAPSTGKSTIAELCAEAFKTQWMPEYGREYWQNNAVDRRLSPEQLVEVAIGHREREDALAAKSNRFLFVDTDASTTEIFSNYYHQLVKPELAAMSADCLTRYDHVFFCADDFDYDDTEDRSGEANRQEFQRRILSQLLAQKRPFRMLRGSLEERLKTVAETLAKHPTKYTIAN